MLLPWWRVGGLLINPAHVAAVDVREEPEAEPTATVYLAAQKPSGGGFAVSVRGKDARLVRRLCLVFGRWPVGPPAPETETDGDRNYYEDYYSAKDTGDAEDKKDLPGGLQEAA